MFAFVTHEIQLVVIFLLKIVINSEAFNPEFLENQKKSFLSTPSIVISLAGLKL